MLMFRIILLTITNTITMVLPKWYQGLVMLHVVYHHLHHQHGPFSPNDMVDHIRIWSCSGQFGRQLHLGQTFTNQRGAGEHPGKMKIRGNWDFFFNNILNNIISIQLHWCQTFTNQQGAEGHPGKMNIRRNWDFFLYNIKNNILNNIIPIQLHLEGIEISFFNNILNVT